MVQNLEHQKINLERVSVDPENLDKLIKKYQSDIEAGRRENGSLKEENESLKEEKGYLKKENNKLKDDLRRESEEKNKSKDAGMRMFKSYCKLAHLLDKYKEKEDLMPVIKELEEEFGGFVEDSDERKERSDLRNEEIIEQVHQNNQALRENLSLKRASEKSEKFSLSPWLVFLLGGAVFVAGAVILFLWWKKSVPPKERIIIGSKITE